MKKIFTTILAVFVLSTSIGAPFTTHTCFADDEKEYSFTLQDDCCGEIPVSNINKSITTECCELYSTFFQVDFDAFSLIKTLSFTPPFEVLIFSFEPVIEDSETEIYAPEDRAPPKAGRILLSLIQSFLI